MRRLLKLQGQAALEFVIVAPVLVLMLAGAVDIGNIARARGLAEAACSEGARYAASQNIIDQSEISGYVMDAFPLDDDCTVRVESEGIPDTRVTMRVEGKTARTVYKRDQVTVYVTIPVRTIFPISSLFGLPGDGTATEIKASKTAVAADLQKDESTSTASAGA